MQPSTCNLKIGQGCGSAVHDEPGQQDRGRTSVRVTKPNPRGRPVSRSMGMKASSTWGTTSWVSSWLRIDAPPCKSYPFDFLRHLVAWPALTVPYLEKSSERSSLCVLQLRLPTSASRGGQNSHAIERKKAEIQTVDSHSFIAWGTTATLETPLMRVGRAPETARIDCMISVEEGGRKKGKVTEPKFGGR